MFVSGTVAESSQLHRRIRGNTGDDWDEPRDDDLDVNPSIDCPFSSDPLQFRPLLNFDQDSRLKTLFLYKLLPILNLVGLSLMTARSVQE